MNFLKKILFLKVNKIFKKIKMMMIFLMYQMIIKIKKKIKLIILMKMLHFNNRIFLKVFKMKNNQIKLMNNNRNKM